MILKPAIEPWCQYSILRDRFDILDDRARAKAGVENGNHGGRDLVGKINQSSRRLRDIGVERDFELVHLPLKSPQPPYQRGQRGVVAWRHPSVELTLLERSRPPRGRSRSGSSPRWSDAGRGSRLPSLSLPAATSGREIGPRNVPVDRLGLAPSGEAIERRVLSIARASSSASVNSPARYCFSVEVIFNHFTLAARSTDG
jgi:hypothetical protein